MIYVINSRKRKLNWIRPISVRHRL
jgi:hypothetical protein